MHKLNFRSTAMTLLIAGVAGMASSSNATPGNPASGQVAAVQVSVPKLKKTIDLRDVGPGILMVRKMTFSPDSRYLAIVESPVGSQADIVVWDLQLGRMQSHIHCPSNYADLPYYDLLWSRDGTVISFGAKRQWNPMTGEALPDNPAIGRGARLNKDGTKLLTIVGAIGEPSYIHVYDTQTWELQNIYVDGLEVSMAAWTADDKIVVSVSVTRETFGKTLDGHVIKWYDTAVRLLDPTGKEPTKAVWFPEQATDDPKSPFTYAFPAGSQGKTNFVTNQIFLDAGRVIDGVTLKISRYHSFDENDVAPGGFGMGFSPDGRLLYLKGVSFPYGGHEPIKNSIVDVASGKPLLQFDGGIDHLGNLAVSPDGKYLALGDAHSILIFSLQ